jgi:hypothetical protein
VVLAEERMEAAFHVDVVAGGEHRREPAGAAAEGGLTFAEGDLDAALAQDRRCRDARDAAAHHHRARRHRIDFMHPRGATPLQPPLREAGKLSAACSGRVGLCLLSARLRDTRLSRGRDRRARALEDIRHARALNGVSVCGDTRLLRSRTVPS